MEAGCGSEGRRWEAIKHLPAVPSVTLLTKKTAFMLTQVRANSTFVKSVFYQDNFAYVTSHFVLFSMFFLFTQIIENKIWFLLVKNAQLQERIDFIKLQMDMLLHFAFEFCLLLVNIGKWMK